VPVRGRAPTVRAIALLAAASAAIHQLRYAIGYGHAGPHELAAHGHAYLALVLPGVLTAVLIALAAWVVRVAGASPRRTAEAQPRALTGLWLGCTLALAAIFGVQETLEGSSAIAAGGWIGLALAVPAGLLVALAVRGTDAAETIPVVSLRLQASAVHSLRVLRISTRARSTRPTRPCGARAPPLPSVV
jgi:hypothetical protein